MKKSLKRTISLALAGTLLLTLVPAAAAAEGDGGAPMATVITKSGMGPGSAREGIYDHPEYFDEGGVDAVIAAGNFYINDFAIPANGDALTETYTVNEDSMTLSKTENGWTVGRTEYATYAEAAKALVGDELPGGLAIDLYDTDADGKAEVAKLWYTEGLIVHKITQNDDGSYSVFRGDLTNVPSNAGRLYDSEHFSATSGEVVKAENLDASIQEGDGAVFYKTPDGWVLERATEANGIFVEGIDHEYYQIDDKTYNDAMKYSRGNLIIAQRNGEFANAHTYFGFKANTQGLKVSLWLDPKSNAPIGLTSNDNARAFLASAIEQSKAKLAAVTLTEQATDEQKLAYSALKEAIQLAETTLADENAANSECDFSVYYLYLTLAGTSGDIGAAFAGFYGVNGWNTQNPYQGFDSYFSSTDGAQNGGDDKGEGDQPAQNTPAQSETPAASTTYTVVKGDCLWNLARKFYGSGAQFGKIAQANGIASPYTIYVGQTLIIPAK
jgi:nucleoid-associated protein YgaU